MKLVGAVTQAGGEINEDGFGYSGNKENVTAAWVFDGVTGINSQSYLPAGTDAKWFVDQAHKHLLRLTKLDVALPEIISRLVQALIVDWQQERKNLHLPDHYDPPAACLVLAKRYGRIWQAARLGDSCLLANYANGEYRTIVESPNNAFDHWLSTEANKRRQAGLFNVKTLLNEFHPQLMAARRLRNTRGSYSILEAKIVALDFAEYFELGSPKELLLCTDGYYRAVDCYAIYNDETFISAAMEIDGLSKVLASLRAVEEQDADCQRFLRFKPCDDATAIVLSI